MKVWQDVDCLKCRGTGRCWNCSGTGKGCRSCESGKCAVCHGKGKVRIWTEVNPVTGKPVG